MQLIKIGVVGASGKMGRAVCDLIKASKNFACAGGISRSNPMPNGVPGFTDMEKLSTNSDVLIDFSNTEFSMKALHAAEAKGKPIVIGTTGFSEKQIAEIRDVAKKIPIVKAANFSTGIATITRILPLLAQILNGYDIEIHETHHRMKKDAPSGTAKSLGSALEQALGPGSECVLNSYSGTREHGKIGMSFSRCGGVFGDHEITFASDHEVVKISHRALSRNVFADGAIKAALWLFQKGKPNLYEMSDVLSDTTPGS